MAKEKHILVGIVLGAHGMKGEVRLKSLTGKPEDIMSLAELETDRPNLTVRITALKQKTPGAFVAKLRDVSDRTTAEQLKGMKLYIHREHLPKTNPDEFYTADLEGLAVVDSKGIGLGVISATYNFGASDLLEIQLNNRTTVIIPFTKESCPEVHIDKGYVVVNEKIVQVFDVQG